MWLLCLHAFALPHAGKAGPGKLPLSFAKEKRDWNLPDPSRQDSATAGPEKSMCQAVCPRMPTEKKVLQGRGPNSALINCQPRTFKLFVPSGVSGWVGLVGEVNTHGARGFALDAPPGAVG